MLRKTENFLFYVTVIILCSLCFSACSSNKPEQGKSDISVAITPRSDQLINKKVVLKVSHVFTVSEPLHIEMVKMAERIAERSGGSLEIRVYPNSELGNNKDNLQQASRGENFIVVADPAYMAEYVPEYNVMTGPFLYNDYKDIKKVTDSEWHQKMIKASSQKGIKILAMDWYFGSRHIISGKVIKKPEDMKGMKVRIPPTKMWSETIKAMSGSPATLQWSEVYSGLSQGIVDAAETALSSFYGAKLYEAKKNIALTSHFMAIAGLEMSQKIFDSLSEEQKTILTEEVETSRTAVNDAVAKAEEEFKVKLQAKGVRFNEVDNAAFKKACEIVYTKFPEWSPGLYEQIKSIVSK